MTELRAKIINLTPHGTLQNNILFGADKIASAQDYEENHQPSVLATSEILPHPMCTCESASRWKRSPQGPGSTSPPPSLDLS
jgi:hypothetical protein